MKKFVFTWNKETYALDPARIVYIERNSRRTEIYTAGGRMFLSSLTIDELAEALPDLARCHNSYLVNMDYIERLSRAEIELNDARILPVSRSRADEMRQAFAEYARTREPFNPDLTPKVYIKLEFQR